MNTPGQVLCRPALSRDRSAVMEFLADIWDGEDYVPEVWDRWLYQEPGLLAVAVVAGEVLGLGHLARMGSGEWWLEGLRVHPKARGRGIGSHLHDYFVDRWLAIGGHVVRLATHRNRTSVHRMCRRTGFRKISEFRAVTAIPSKRPGNDILKQLERTEMMEAIQAIQAGEVCRALGGLMDYGWRFARPLLDRLRSIDRLFKDENGDFHLLRMERTELQPDVHVLASSASQARISEGLRAISAWAEHQAANHVTWLLPNSEGWLKAASEAGFDASNGEALIIFERRR